jgi:hypothetical protein
MIKKTFAFLRELSNNQREIFKKLFRLKKTEKSAMEENLIEAWFKQDSRIVDILSDLEKKN